MSSSSFHLSLWSLTLFLFLQTWSLFLPGGLCTGCFLSLECFSPGSHMVDDFYLFITCLLAKSLQSCPTLCDPLYCSLPGSFVHGTLQARILEWAPMPSSRWSSQPRIEPCLWRLLHWQACFLPLVLLGKPLVIHVSPQILPLQLGFLHHHIWKWYLPQVLLVPSSWFLVSVPSITV